MGKYLDSIDYNKIVLNTFQLPESDFYKYYSNVVEEHLTNNSDLFDELIAAIERRIEWYREHFKKCHEYDGLTWGLDDDGKTTLIHPDTMLISLYSSFNINRQINKSFFDEQIRIVRLLSIQHSIRNTITKLRGEIEKKPKGRKVRTFEGLFNSKGNANKVLSILTEEEYLISGKWTYSGIDKSIAIPFYVLRDYFGLIKDDGSPLGTKLKTWCSGLGITYDDVKNLKKNPEDGINPTRKFRMAQKEFFVLFKSHFQPIKQLV